MSSRKEWFNSLSVRLFDRLERSFCKKSALQAERSGIRLGTTLYKLDRKHRERTYANLLMAFPEWSEEKRHEVALNVFRHFGIVAGDFMRTKVRNDDEVFTNMEVEGFEHFEAAEAQGKGVLVVTGHFGNWERFAQWVRAGGRHISVVARDANQQGVQERVSKIREATGISLLSRGNSAREILVRLRRKEIVGLLPDQNTDEVFVPFFGKLCGTVLGPAVLHKRTGAPLLPAFCVRTGPATYKVIVYPAIDLDNTESDQLKITSEMNAVLESMIRRYPEQWLWMHDRWKDARNAGLLDSDVETANAARLAKIEASRA